MTQEEIDALINSGGAGGGSGPGDVDDGGTPAPVEINEADFPDLDAPSTGGAVKGGPSPLDPKMELLYDLQLPVSIELGRTNMLIRDILRMGRGYVVEFDKLASEPVDLLVNGKKIAEGEVVVIDKHFGIRITTLIDPADRIKIGGKR